MVYYKIEAKREINESHESSENTRDGKLMLASLLADCSEELFHKSFGESIVFAVMVKGPDATFAAIAESKEEVVIQFKKYMKTFPFRLESYNFEEVTFGMLESMLASAYRGSYIRDENDILDKFGIGELNERGCIFGESMIDDSVSFDDCKKLASAFLFDDTMHPEIDRISAGTGAIKTVGHPVHYMVMTDDRNIRKVICKSLLSALYISGRVKNKRYSFVDFDSDSHFPGGDFDTLYRSSEGGALIIRYTSCDEKDKPFAKRGYDIIKALCEIATRYKNKVLTIICIPTVSNKVKEEFLSNWGSTAFIELHEGIAYKETAEKYLKGKASENKIRGDRKLLSCIEEERGYTSSELNRFFDEWYSKKLRNEIYPQYKNTQTAKIAVAKEENKGSAYDKLERLIGLESAKSVMNNALNYFKAQKLFADRGMVAERPSMHMVFTGNPGTAKTTVARLFAEILRENGILPNGNMYEVGRADIVGKYVGSTAPLVKAAFRRAKGGVLFIDEAYSLVDDRDGLYGDEAINTIVQEMENNRKDTIVIFAGYPDKMDSFLNKNPGLRSRIAFHIPFEDYSADELCDIAKLIAAEKNFKMTDDAIDKLKPMFDSARKNGDFGNGRYARNVIEKAKMAQANRILKLDFEHITDDELKTITADDIEVSEEKNKQKTNRIGFCA